MSLRTITSPSASDNKVRPTGAVRISVRFSDSLSIRRIARVCAGRSTRLSNSTMPVHSSPKLNSANTAISANRGAIASATVRQENVETSFQPDSGRSSPMTNTPSA